MSIIPCFGTNDRDRARVRRSERSVLISPLGPVGTIGPSVTAAVACALLLWILVEDFRRYRIRNVAVMALVVCFVFDCAVRDRLPLVVSHGFVAGVGLALAAGMFALKMMGGGDAKLLSAAVFWVGPEGVLVFALLLFIVTVLYAIGAWSGVMPARRIGGRLAIPFGPAIASALVACIGLSLWLSP